MEMIDSINVEKFNDGMVVIGKGRQCEVRLRQTISLR